MAKPVVVNIIGDDSRLKKTLDSSQSKLGAFGSKVKGMLGPALAAAGAAAGLALVGGLVSGIKGAAELEDQISKVKTVFKLASDDVLEFANTTAKGLGISRKEALKAAGNFGNFFTQLGLSTGVASSFSMRLVKLTGDLSSFNGIPTAEAQEKVTSALLGEYDGLQSLGVAINETMVQQKAMAMTGKKSADSLTEAEKATARYFLMLEGTKNATGDFARTQDTAANRMKVVKAQFEDLKDQLGQKLLPAFTALMGFIINRVLPGLSNLSGFLGKTFGPAIERIKNLFTNFGKSSVETAGMFKTVKDIVTTNVQIVRDIFSTVVSFLVAFWKRNGDSILKTARSIWDSFSSILKSAQSIIQTILGAIHVIWRVFGDNIMKAVSGALNGIMTILRGAFKIIEGIFKTVSSVLRGDWKGAWDGIKTILSGAWSIIRGIFQTILSVLKGIWDNLKTLLTGIWRGMWDAIKNAATSKWDEIKKWASGIPTSLKTAIGNLAGALVDKFKGAFNALLGKDGALQTKWNEIKSWAAGVPGSLARAMGDIGQALADKFKLAVDRVKEILGIKSPSSVFHSIGKWMMQGLINGIKAKAGGTWNTLKDVFSSSLGAVKGVIAKGKVASWLMQALSITGTSMTWLPALIRRAMAESGGNPHAINLWDINAKRGIPSKGLMQTIGPTFNAFKLPGLNDIWNPVHNAVAAIRYIKARYGSVFSRSYPQPPKGYAEGAWRIPRNELAMIHKGEMVLPARIADAVRGAFSGSRMAAAPSVTIYAQTNASAADIAADVVWGMKTAGR